MITPSDTARLLAQATYRWHDNEWQYRAHWTNRDWFSSATLRGEDYAGGVQIIAACPWANLDEEGSEP